MIPHLAHSPAVTVNPSLPHPSVTLTHRASQLCSQPNNVPFPAPALSTRMPLEKVVQLHGQGPNERPLRASWPHQRLAIPPLIPTNQPLFYSLTAPSKPPRAPMSPQTGTLTGSLSWDDFASYFAEKIEAIRKGHPHLPVTPPTNSAHWHCPSCHREGALLHLSRANPTKIPLHPPPP